ncbi:MAG: phenylacetate-CoA oxygenase/reductase subunit PaaK [Herminiimonas sp.]|nr:phenylacetate-CoA oxygenase/reductase subunit PaaK [Herminiimonas sp.]
MTPQFHSLTIRDIRRETADSISLAFAVPLALQDAYRFTQGQFLTLRSDIDGAEVRRSYSICSSVDDYAQRNELRIAIKAVEGGLFSNFVSKSVRPGMVLQVMTPDGRFFTALDDKHAKHYVAFAAGSGITPILSLLKTTLAHEPLSRFTLVYGNRARESILFCEELEDLKNRYLSRFMLHHVLSRAPNEIALAHGRIDEEKCAALLQLIPATTIDEAFVCGPADMIDTVESALLGAGVPRKNIHAERFGVPVARSSVPAAPVAADDGSRVPLDILLDGKRFAMMLPRTGASILDVALAAGLDLPYACKGGVCCTCRAKVIEGSVAMDKNYTLEDWEMAQGFVLTCQSHPTSDKVVVSFDER